MTNLGDGVAELISVGTLQLFDDDHSVFVSLANSTKSVRAGKVAGKTRPDASVADARKRARDGVEAGAPVDAAKKAANKAARKKSKAPGKQTENVPVAAGASESAIAKKVATPRSRAARVGK